ncbi:MAG: prepilin-type N-terminal cleavage/methylation domain-containing protein [Candidatus Omnitrophota bacterium]|nr:prepilin-type N-terminal cleavage/methylation domain-containing protein [Candidatus Omnitrophota bacterium]
MDRRTQELKNRRTREIVSCSSVLPFFRSSVIAGLTLVELMVASSILAIGLVMVGRGLLAASATLDSVEDRLEAIQFLDAKLAQLRQEAESQGGVAAETRSGAVALRHRQATWTLDIVPLEPEALLPHGMAQEQAGPETQEPPIRLASARFRLSWQEGRRTQDAVLATYLDYKPPAAGEEGPTR